MPLFTRPRIGGPLVGSTQGSIIFAGVNGIFQQDNANLFWDDTNNALGIGTATPAGTETFSKLTVEKSDAIALYSAVINTGAGQAGFILRRSGGTAIRWGLYIPTGSTDLRLVETTTDRFRFQADGSFISTRVGIGTIAPSNKLDIVTGNTNDSQFHLGEAATGGAYITSRFDDEFTFSGGAEVVGNVAIARATEASVVQMFDGTFTLFTDAGLTVGNSFSATNRLSISSAGVLVINETGASTGDVRIEGDTAVNLFFLDASADFIGIGKSNPASLLDVSGNTNVDGNIAVGGGTVPSTTTLLIADNNTASKRFTTANTNFNGLSLTVVAAITSGSTSGILTGSSGRAVIESPNTQNWTADVGVRGVSGAVLIRPTSGTITGAASFYGANDVSTGGTVTNFYGLYLEDMSRGTNNYGIYQTGTTDINYFAGNVGVGISAPAAKLHIDQASTTAAVPVLTIDQADISEEFIRFIGTSANGVLTQSIVEAADVATATIAGYLKVYISDDGNQLADASYYLPIYTLA